MHDFDASSNIRSSSETSSSLGSLADSGFSSRERTHSKCMLEADVERLGFRLTSNPESVGSKEPNSVSTRENNAISDKSVQNVEREGMGKPVWAQSAAFKRHRSPTLGTSSSLLRNGETLRTSEILSIEAAIADLQNSCLGDTEIKKYSKDIKSAFNTDLSSSCELNGRGPRAIQEESKKKLLPKSASPLASDCSDQKTVMKQMKPADAPPVSSPKRFPCAYLYCTVVVKCNRAFIPCLFELFLLQSLRIEKRVGFGAFQKKCHEVCNFRLRIFRLCFRGLCCFQD